MGALADIADYHIDQMFYEVLKFDFRRGLGDTNHFVPPQSEYLLKWGILTEDGEWIEVL